MFVKILVNIGSKRRKANLHHSVFATPFLRLTGSGTSTKAELNARVVTIDCITITFDPVHDPFSFFYLVFLAKAMESKHQPCGSPEALRGQWEKRCGAPGSCRGEMQASRCLGARSTRGLRQEGPHPPQLKIRQGWATGFVRMQPSEGAKLMRTLWPAYLKCDLLIGPWKKIGYVYALLRFCKRKTSEMILMYFPSILQHILNGNLMDTRLLLFFDRRIVF